MKKSNSERNLTTEPDARTMDVILLQDGTLHPSEDYVGNNRFRILLDIQSKKFASSNEIDQSRIAADLVDIVVRHWGGRFVMSARQLDESESQQNVLAILRRKTDTLATPTMAGLDVQSMRSAAIKNLKASKQKKELVSKILEQRKAKIKNHKSFCRRRSFFIQNM